MCVWGGTTKKITDLHTLYCVKCGHEESWHDEHGCFFVNDVRCRCKGFVLPETVGENVRVPKKKVYHTVGGRTLFPTKQRPIAFITKKGGRTKEPFFGG